MACIKWASGASAPTLTTTPLGTECFFTTLTPGAGIVVTPDGINFFRIYIDTDAETFLFTPIVSPLPTDFVWSTAGIGPVFSPVISKLFRLQCDSNGIYTVPVTPSGWYEPKPLNTTTFTQDIGLANSTDGIILTTIDGLHTVRVKVDTDGTPLSQQVS